MGILQATANLCEFSGPPYSDVGIGILMNLSADDRPPRVRSAAKRELLALFTKPIEVIPYIPELRDNLN